MSRREIVWIAHFLPYPSTENDFKILWNNTTIVNEFINDVKHFGETQEFYILMDFRNPYHSREIFCPPYIPPNVPTKGMGKIVR